jgi:hypothetical protein
LQKGKTESLKKIKQAEAADPSQAGPDSSACPGLARLKR